MEILFYIWFIHLKSILMKTNFLFPNVLKKPSLLLLVLSFIGLIFVYGLSNLVSLYQLYFVELDLLLCNILIV